MILNTCKFDGRYHGLAGATIPLRRLFIAPLIAAAVLGVSQPAAVAEFDIPGPDFWCAWEAVTNPLCQNSSTYYAASFILPEFGGVFRFINNGRFIMATDGAHVYGDIFGGGIAFSVALDFTAPVAPPTSPILDVHVLCTAGGTDEWIAYTEFSGELVGLPGSEFDGARYAITGTSEAQIGVGANRHNSYRGLFATLNYELVDPVAYPNLPVGPFAGDISLTLAHPSTGYGSEYQELYLRCFPIAEPDLTGTWTGTIDCVGFDWESAFGARPVESFFSAAVLEIGRSTNPMDLGDQYSVRLTREAGNAQSFCAFAPNNPGSITNLTGGHGVLVEPQRHATRVYFKFEGETLKARELIAEGLHGTQLCKWNLTRTSTTPPTVADACSPVECIMNPPDLQCDDNAVCGQALGFEDWDYTCTCADGYVGDGDSCTPAP